MPWWVPLVEFAVDEFGAVVPRASVFSEEPITSHDISFHESIFPNGLQHVLRGCGAEVTAGATDVCDDIVMEEDDLLG